jgi:AmmeMemoRadiSam system protein B
MFYPDRPDELRDLVDRLLAAAVAGDDGVSTPTGEPVPKALIAPHAGYIYSGPIAASAYARWLPARERITRVVLLGPAHRVPVRTMARSSADEWQTPLGAVPIEPVELDGAVVDDDAHAPEHSLEVHLPFLQRVLDSFTLVPIVVGHAPATLVADALERCWGGDETGIVISTDLSHYHDYATASDLDRDTAAAIVTGARPLVPTDACGAYPVNGMVEAARRRHLGVELLDLRNSGDTAGDRNRVVGYGAFTVGVGS